MQGSGKKWKVEKKSASGIMFLWLCDQKHAAQSYHHFLLESTADKGISVCSSQREVRQTSHRVRRKRGLCRASGSQRDKSGSNRPLLQKTQRGEKEQVRPERAALSVTNHFVTPNPQCQSKHWPSPNQSELRDSLKHKLPETALVL